MTDEHDDWQDRLVDAALREVHGAPPPDLSARVLLALETGDAAPQAPMPRLTRRRRLPRWPLLVVAAAAAGIALALLFASQAGGGQAGDAPPAADRFAAADGLTANLQLAVSRGELVCVAFAADGTTTTPLVPGGAVVWPARRGNRLRTAAGCDLQIASFGAFALEPVTELEVRSMEFTLKNGVVAASSLTVAVVAGVITWHALTHSETAAAGEVLRVPAQSAAPEPTLLAENERLRQRIGELERLNEALQTQAARTAAPDQARPAEAEPTPAKPPDLVPATGSVAFDDPRYAAALASVDWRLVGDTTRDMGPLLAQLMQRLAAGEEMPLDLVAKVSKLNANLIDQLPELMKAKLPGYGPNGTFTHPLVVANSLASTLASSGMPLNDAQRAAIDGLVRVFSAENESAAAQERDFSLEQLAAEAELKDRFYHELSTRLTPDQMAIMFPTGADAYDGGSLFHSSLMTQPYAEPVQAKDGADFARIAAGKLREFVGLDDAKAAQAQAIIARYAAAKPEMWQAGPGPRPAGSALQALRMQVQFLQEIRRTVGLSAEQLAKLKDLRRFLLPASPR